MFFNGHECFKHSHCHSGFCLAGRCSAPTKIHDPCNAHNSKCPSGTYCSSFSNTCIPYSYTRKLTCLYQSDCHSSEMCVNGRCKKLLKTGDSCSLLSPDYCELGSKCTTASLSESRTRCYELCSFSVPCAQGFTCSFGAGVCVPESNSLVDFDYWPVLQLVAAFLAIFILLFGLIYAWVKVTRTAVPDPRIKKKRVRLQYEGNGLASITVVPSHDPSPAPVAAAQLFNDNAAITQPPPPYSVAVKLPR